MAGWQSVDLLGKLTMAQQGNCMMLFFFIFCNNNVDTTADQSFQTYLQSETRWTSEQHLWLHCFFDLKYRLYTSSTLNTPLHTISFKVTLILSYHFLSIQFIYLSIYALSNTIL